MKEIVTHPLFNPFQLGRFFLANRTVVAPMTRNSATAEGVPTTEMQEYYADFARGGFGIIITEGVYTDSIASRCNPNQPGIVTAAQKQGWAAVVRQVKQYPSLFICQLMHAGALSQDLVHTIAPSAVQPTGSQLTDSGGKGGFLLPKEMDKQDIAAAQQGYIKSAVAAWEAGFDGVEVHAANGYLPDQFLTAYTNLRTDNYGGSFENKFRFIAEIIAGIRQATSPDFIIGLRLSESKVNNLTYRMPGGAADATEIVTQAAKTSLSYIHIAAEGGKWERECRYADGSSYNSIARQIAGVPVIANGGLHDPEMARFILEEGHGDLISIGRAALADPAWPRKMQEGHVPIPFHKNMISPDLSLAHTRRYRESLSGQPVN